MDEQLLFAACSLLLTAYQSGHKSCKKSKHFPDPFSTLTLYFPALSTVCQVRSGQIGRFMTPKEDLPRNVTNSKLKKSIVNVTLMTCKAKQTWRTMQQGCPYTAVIAAVTGCFVLTKQCDL